MTGKISQIPFKILTEEETSPQSVSEVTAPESHDAKGAPVPRGVSDSKTGSIRSCELCKTCNRDALNCTGHIGQIFPKEPALNILVLPLVVGEFNDFCGECGTLKEVKHDAQDSENNSEKITAVLLLIKPNN